MPPNSSTPAAEPPNGSPLTRDDLRALAPMDAHRLADLLARALHGIELAPDEARALGREVFRLRRFEADHRWAAPPAPASGTVKAA